MNKRVVVTGLGIISPIGCNLKDFHKSLKDGKSGISTITRFDVNSFPSRIGGEIKDCNPRDHLKPKFVRNTDRFTQIGTIAAQNAIQDANLTLDELDKVRIGITMGTSIGGLGVGEDQHALFLEKGYKKINPFMQTSVFPSSCSSHIALYFDLHGPAETISTACSSSNSAIASAMQRFRYGGCDIMIAGGADVAITPFILGSFCALRMVSKRNDEPEKACRPFSKDRDGIVLSEGSAVLILEELTHALKRNAFIYGELIGYGTTCDAYHITTPYPNADYAALAMEKAFKDAGINKDQVDYINAHGSATSLNDLVETRIIKKYFGKRAYDIPISATKSMMGHAMGAGGAIELAACFLMLQNDFIHPTINYTVPDPECDLFYVPGKAIDRRVNTIMSNSFGYGGQNSIIILQRLNYK